MAILDMDSFDGYNGSSGFTLQSRGWPAGIGIQPISSAARWAGGQGLQATTNGQLGRPFPGGPVSTGSVAFAFRKVSTMSSITTLVALNSGTGTAATDRQLSLCMDATTGDIILYRGSSAGVELGRYALGFSIDTWYHFALEATIADAGGTATVYVEGVPVITYTGDTRNVAAAATFDRPYFLGGGGGLQQWDDYYASTSFEGVKKFTTLRVTGDTAQKDLTASSGGSNYLMVDEVNCDNDTTYVSSSTPGHKDRYTLEDLTETPDSITAVCVVYAARKDDVAARSTRANLKSGATTANCTAYVLNSTYGGPGTTGHMFTTDPNTGAAWTATGVNGLEVELEVVS